MEFFQLQNNEMILQLLLAAILGGLVGMERQVMHRPAGLKTYILVSLGCTLFTIVSYAGFEKFIGSTSFDPSRIAAGILTGIGFIGAGTILRKEDRIEGVTTAAGLWMVAAVGMAVGLKLYFLSISATILTLAVLIILRVVENRLRLKSFNKNKNE